MTQKGGWLGTLYRNVLQLICMYPKQHGAAEARRAHNPEGPRSKRGVASSSRLSDLTFSLFLALSSYYLNFIELYYILDEFLCSHPQRRFKQRLKSVVTAAGKTWTAQLRHEQIRAHFFHYLFYISPRHRTTFTVMYISALLNPPGGVLQSHARLVFFLKKNQKKPRIW